MIVHSKRTRQPVAGHRFTQKSLTEPRKLLTVREMLYKHTQGGFLHTSRGEGVYHPEELEIPDPQTLDLDERAEFSANWKKRQDELEAKAKDEKTAAAEAAKKKAEEAEALLLDKLEKKRKDKPDSPPSPPLPHRQ